MITLAFDINFSATSCGHPDPPSQSYSQDGPTASTAKYAHDFSHRTLRYNILKNHKKSHLASEDKNTREGEVLTLNPLFTLQ